MSSSLVTLKYIYAHIDYILYMFSFCLHIHTLHLVLVLCWFLPAPVCRLLPRRHDKIVISSHKYFCSRSKNKENRKIFEKKKSSKYFIACLAADLLYSICNLETFTLLAFKLVDKVEQTKAHKSP